MPVRAWYKLTFCSVRLFVIVIPKTGDGCSYRGSKTGLGSSAALVSSLTGAVLATFADTSGPFADFSGPVAASRGKTLAFVVAQLAHAEAQHSIGSGFDIASAVVGSCRYVRFSPERLAGVFKETSDGVEPLSDAAFRDLILDSWDHEVWSPWTPKPTLEPVGGSDSALKLMCR